MAVALESEASHFGKGIYVQVISKIVLYGATLSAVGEPELLTAQKISRGVAQIATTPFATNWVAAKDIVAFDEVRRISRVLVRNGRTFYGQFSVSGLNDIRIARTAERVGRFLAGFLIQCTFVSFSLPGVFSMSVDVRLPLEHLWDLAYRSPVKFRVLCREEIAML